MKKITVELGNRSYEARVGTGLLERLGLWLREKDFSGKAVVITDAVVNSLYSDNVIKSLGNAGFAVSLLEVPVGEKYKTLEVAAGLYEKMTDAHAERTTPVLALGGGVIGDLAGFVAATYMRGVPLVQVPTTLLAQTDSSIGGKTAVDHGQLKNTIGVFYQPVLVAADIDTLHTLPTDEFSSGLAEVIKSAAVRNRNFFTFLEINIGRIRELHPDILEDMIAEAVHIKAEVVNKDEKEAGLREILNFGHTVGHAVESISGFTLKHGQAVAIGMVAAARLSVRLGVLDEGEAVRLERLITGAGLPTTLSGFNQDDIIAAMRHDKKVRQDKIRFVLLKSIGNAFIADDVDPALVKEVLVGQG
jgi:3-dehydroquinate synthase